jgi:hypothetical protein
MTGKQFVIVSALLILLGSTGCRSWCEHRYGPCCAPAGTTSAQPCCPPCQPCNPCGAPSGYPTVPPPPAPPATSFDNPRAGCACPPG